MKLSKLLIALSVSLVTEAIYYSNDTVPFTSTGPFYLITTVFDGTTETLTCSENVCACSSFVTTLSDYSLTSNIPTSKSETYSLTGPEEWQTVTIVGTSTITLTCQINTCSCKDPFTTVVIPTGKLPAFVSVPSVTTTPKAYSEAPHGATQWLCTTQIQSKIETLTCSKTICSCESITTTIPNEKVPSTTTSFSSKAILSNVPGTWEYTTEINRKTETLTCTETVCKAGSITTTVPTEVVPTTIPEITLSTDVVTPVFGTVIVSCVDNKCSTSILTPNDYATGMAEQKPSTTPYEATVSITCSNNKCTSGTFFLKTSTTDSFSCTGSQCTTSSVPTASIIENSGAIAISTSFIYGLVGLFCFIILL